VQLVAKKTPKIAFFAWFTPLRSGVVTQLDFLSPRDNIDLRCISKIKARLIESRYFVTLLTFQFSPFFAEQAENNLVVIFSVFEDFLTLPAFNLEAQFLVHPQTPFVETEH
jgi:hypothetical protein